MTVSARSLGLLRLCLGWLVWSQWAAPMRGVHHLADPAHLGLTAVFWVATPFLVAGLGARVAAAVVFAVLLLHVGRAGEWRGIGHPEDPWVLLGAVGLLALGPCGASWSVDRWLAVRAAGDGPPPAQVGPAWVLPLLVLHLGVLQLAAAARLIAGGEIVAVAVGAALVVATLGFVRAATRPTAIGLALAAHAALSLWHPGGLLPPTAAVLLVAAIDPGAFDRGLDRLAGRRAG